MFSTIEEALKNYGKRHNVDWYTMVANYVKFPDNEDFDQDHWDRMIANGAEVMQFDGGELIAWVQTKEQRERCNKAIEGMKAINQKRSDR